MLCADLFHRISRKSANKCGNYGHKLISKHNGCQCAEFRETHNHSIIFCKHLLRRILPKLREKRRKYRKISLTHVSRVELPQQRFSTNTNAQRNYVEVIYAKFHPNRLRNMGSTGTTSFVPLPPLCGLL